MPPATNRTQRKRPGDLTGVRGQTLAQEAAANKAEAAKQVQSALEVQREERINNDVDYSSPHKSVERVVVNDGTGNVVVEEIEVEVPTRRIRVNYPIEDMTFGREIISHGKMNEEGLLITPPVLGSLRQFTFEEGRWYVVDADVAEHLAFLGYIYE